MIDRDRMLIELTAAMRRRHTLRRRRSRAAAAFATVAVTAVAILIATPHPEPAQRADPVVKVLRNAPRTGLVKTIDDDELVDRLAEIAMPTGLIRTDGRVWLTDPPV